MSRRKYYPPPEGDYITKEQYDEILAKETLPYYLLLFEIMWRMGLRVSEALSIRPMDIDPKETSAKNEGLQCEHIIRLWRKGNRLQFMPLEDDLRDRLVKYYSPRRIKRDERIFPVGRRAVLARLNKYGYTVGGKKKIHPHALRRGMGVWEIRNGTPLTVVQAVYNHRRPNMTFRYIGMQDTTALNDWIRIKRERSVEHEFTHNAQ